MAEVTQLENVSTRLAALADMHPPVTEGLLVIAGNVRSNATVLALLAQTRLAVGDGDQEEDGDGNKTPIV